MSAPASGSADPNQAAVLVAPRYRGRPVPEPADVRDSEQLPPTAALPEQDEKPKRKKRKKRKPKNSSNSPLPACKRELPSRSPTHRRENFESSDSKAPPSATRHGRSQSRSPTAAVLDLRSRSASLRVTVGGTRHPPTPPAPRRSRSELEAPPPAPTESDEQWQWQDRRSTWSYSNQWSAPHQDQSQSQCPICGTVLKARGAKSLAAAMAAHQATSSY